MAEAEARTGGASLVARPTPSPWDADLAAAMAGAGVAVYEEQVIDVLLADLRGAARRADGAPTPTS